MLTTPLFSPLAVLCLLLLLLLLLRVPQSAAVVLASAAASVEPFDVLLRDFRVFVHKKSATLWLHPEPSRSEALQKLQAALQDAMPLCDAQRSSHGTFTPHVTVGHFESEEAALSARNQIIASGWQGVEFPVSEVVLMARSEGGGSQFEPRWRVRLGRSAGLAAAAAHGERFGLMPTEMPAFCEREPRSKKDRAPRKDSASASGAKVANKPGPQIRRAGRFNDPTAEDEHLPSPDAPPEPPPRRRSA